MKHPLWTHPLFAAFVALLFVVAAAGIMKLAVLYAQLKVDPLARVQHDTTKAILLLILSMLLVIGSLVVPLVIRRKAQRRLERDSGAKA
jgi:hypothetical protein